MHLKEIKKILRKWASENADIRTVYIYGSRLRGDYNENSDLDVAIDLNRNKGQMEGHAIWTSYGTELEQELQSLLPYNIHLEYYDKNRKDLVKDIVRTAIENYCEEVYSRDESEKRKKLKDEQKQGSY